MERRRIIGCRIWNGSYRSSVSRLLTNNFPILNWQESAIGFRSLADQNTILIGHSSGAVAAMRYAETHKLAGSVLVGVCYTDLGYDTEKQSGYYDDPWKWQAIKNNQPWIIQFASTDDPFIPIEEARFIQKNLDTDYYEYTDQGHFGHGDHPRCEFPELIAVLASKMK